MPRPDEPTLRAIEADQADVAQALLALSDLSRLWGELDEDAALALLLQAFRALKRIKTRAKQRHQEFSKTYHNT